jgi:hypothetical protein
MRQRIMGNKPAMEIVDTQFHRRILQINHDDIAIGTSK